MLSLSSLTHKSMASSLTGSSQPVAKCVETHCNIKGTPEKSQTLLPEVEVKQTFLSNGHLPRSRDSLHQLSHWRSQWTNEMQCANAMDCTGALQISLHTICRLPLPQVLNWQLRKGGKKRRGIRTRLLAAWNQQLPKRCPHVHSFQASIRRHRWLRWSTKMQKVIMYNEKSIW